jgi:cbb3-type cytochrome oxidase subunit 3
MMELLNWLAAKGNLVILVMFFAMFLGFALWAYAPTNRKRMKKYGDIPLREAVDGEQ